MLRNTAEAEDIVQDVWLRWQLADRRLVRNATAFLATTATRLAINVMHSARARRETPVEPTLPEQVDDGADPRLDAERGQAVAFAMGSLLETLTHAERAAFILREAFDYPYHDIAQVLRLQEAHTRQLVSRARLHLSRHRRTRANGTDQRRLLDAFIAAARHGDIAGLEGVLSQRFIASGQCS